MPLKLLCQPGGSSPLTRGALCVGGGEGVHGGLIPAHAGSTVLGLCELVDDGGSSPLTRGARKPLH
ncbi:hypothetical protein HMPREF3227_02440 [Corynebacterium sp. CMW7794]|nr:hypothetical protein HMPREF3227_02440 [Corynebacterium sp. CMW7794]